MKKKLIFLQILLIITENYVKSDESEISKKIVQSEKERLKHGRRMASYMDTNVDPCEDFYTYACGNYFNIHKEERALGRFGPFFMLRPNFRNTLHEMLMEPIINRTNSEKVSAADKAKYFYQSCLNENIFTFKKSEAYLNLIDSFGGWPILKPDWKSSDFNWFNASCILRLYGVKPIIDEIPHPDESSSLSLLVLAQFGLFKMTNDINRPYSRLYQKNKKIIKHILSMYGIPKKSANQIFKDIMNFGENFHTLQESSKAKGFQIVDEIKFEELQKLVPHLNWTMFYSPLYQDNKFKNITVKILYKDLFNRLHELFTGENIRRAANYFIVKMLFELHSELRSWKDMKTYCISITTQLLNPVISAMFLDSKYHEKYIEDEVLGILSYVRSAFKDSIKSIDWLDKKTRKGALKKLNNVDIIIGDSQLTLDMEKFDEELADVEVSLKNGFRQNYLNLRKFAITNYRSRKPLNKINRIDVIPSYSFHQNQLIIPAGIFQKPFYNIDLPKAYNFGIIGSILGHELTHSLDTDGIYYDETGNETDWFSREADTEYRERAQCFVKQYNKYRLEVSRHTIDGSRTLPDNIADNGGLRHSFYGYKNWLEANIGSLDMSKQTLPGFNMTDEQFFFLSFAQTWCEKITGFQEVTSIRSKVHSPGKFRVLGSVSNFDEFSKAFLCKKGSAMNPQEKCMIW